MKILKPRTREPAVGMRGFRVDVQILCGFAQSLGGGLAVAG